MTGKNDDADVLEDSPGHTAKTLAYIIFRNTHVIYRGGAITLINVFFDNCTFEIQQDSNGFLLAKEVFAKPFVDLKLTVQ